MTIRQALLKLMYEMFLPTKNKNQFSDLRYQVPQQVLDDNLAKNRKILQKAKKLVKVCLRSS